MIEKIINFFWDIPELQGQEITSVVSLELIDKRNKKRLLTLGLIGFLIVNKNKLKGIF